MKESLRTLLTKLLHFFIGSAIVWALPASFNPLSFLAAFIPSIFAPSLLIPCITAGIGILIYSAIPDKFKKPAQVLRFLAFLSFGPLCTFGVCGYKAYKIHSEGSLRARVIVVSLIALYIFAAVLNPVPMPPLISHLFFGTFFTGLFYLGCFLLIAANTIQHKHNPASPSYILGRLFNPIQSETPQEQEASQNDTMGTSKIESMLKSLAPKEVPKNFSTLFDAFRENFSTLRDSLLGIYQATKALSDVLLGSSLVRSLDNMASPEAEAEKKAALITPATPPAALQPSSPDVAQYNTVHLKTP
jgi:hypothetical protein